MYHHVGVNLTKESSYIMFLQSESANYVGMMVIKQPAERPENHCKFKEIAKD